MTVDRDTVIRLREQADDWAENELQCTGEYHPDFHVVSDERFAALVAAHEREECAKVVERRITGVLHNVDQETRDCAAAIRSRTTHKTTQEGHFSNE